MNEPLLAPAVPAAPVAAWIGGKRNLARRIIARLGQVEHTAYVEPFVGMGGVFLRRPFRARAEGGGRVREVLITPGGLRRR